MYCMEANSIDPRYYDIHKIDNHIHWEEYIIKAPGYMGINALPVPELFSLSEIRSTDLRLSERFHFHQREFSYSQFFQVNLYLGDEVSLFVNADFFEYYRMDSILRDYRRSPDMDGTGVTGGDIKMGVRFKLENISGFIPYIDFEIKTASGNKLSALRHSETPGFYSSLVLEKQISKYTFLIRNGIYSWNVDNEEISNVWAYLYGIRIIRSLGGHSLVSGEISGYTSGFYKKSSPVFLRALYEYSWIKTAFGIHVSHGMNHVLYTTIGFTFKVIIHEN